MMTVDAVRRKLSQSAEKNQISDFILRKGDFKTTFNMNNVRNCWVEIKAFALDSEMEEKLKIAICNHDEERPLLEESK